MSLYINRIRYKGITPTIASSSGIVNNAVYDGLEFYENYEPTPPEHDYSLDYFTLTSWQDNNTVYFHQGRQSDGNAIVMYMSTDKTNWTNITSGYSTGDLINLGTFSKGQSIYFKGDNIGLTYPGTFPTNQSSFFASKKYELSGNIMSLLWGDNFIGKTTLPNSSAKYVFQNLVSCYNYPSYRNSLLSIRNLVMPCTEYVTNIYTSMFEQCNSLIYANKEMPSETFAAKAQYDLAMFRQTRIQDTPVFRVTVAGNNQMYDLVCQDSTQLKRAIFLCSSSYPSVPGSPIKYKLSTNTVSGTYRDFDTLQAQGAFLSIWAETETPYDGIVAGCSDYFIAGDTVTLEYVSINGTFNGYYDENDNLLSSNSTYTFTAQRSMKIKVKTT